jgi:hypothetical protein
MATGSQPASKPTRTNDAVGRALLNRHPHDTGQPFAVPGINIPPVPPDMRPARVAALLHGTPLEAEALVLVQAADRAGIDWRLLPAIAIKESGGGARPCGYNAWGYDACQGPTFGSWAEGAAVVAATLAAPPYAGEDTASALSIWVSGNEQGGRVYAASAMGLMAQLEP